MEGNSFGSQVFGRVGDFATTTKRSVILNEIRPFAEHGDISLEKATEECVEDVILEAPITTLGTDSVSVCQEAANLDKEVLESSREHSFNGNLTDVRKGQSNILQNKAKIIKGFVDVMAREIGGGVEQSPLPPTEIGCPAHPSSSKWDRTPIQDIDVGYLILRR